MPPKGTSPVCSQQLSRSPWSNTQSLSRGWISRSSPLAPCRSKHALCVMCLQTSNWVDQTQTHCTFNISRLKAKLKLPLQRHFQKEQQITIPIQIFLSLSIMGNTLWMPCSKHNYTVVSFPLSNLPSQQFWWCIFLTRFKMLEMHSSYTNIK